MKLPPPFQDEEKGIINILAETPRGSRNKYAYDEECDVFRLKKILPSDVVFPLDFGSIPGTCAEDGDMLDVLFYMEKPTFPGCIIEARLLGVMEAKQKKKGAPNFYRNDRLLAVAVGSTDYEAFQTISDIDSYQLESLSHFFEYYHTREGDKYIPLENKGPEAALALIRKHVISGKK